MGTQREGGGFQVAVSFVRRLGVLWCDSHRGYVRVSNSFRRRWELLVWFDVGDVEDV